MPIRISAKTIDLDLLRPIATVHLVTLTIVREARHQTHSNQVRRITHPRQPCPTSQPRHSSSKVWFLSSISQAQCHPNSKELRNTNTINLDRVGGDGYICIHRFTSNDIRDTSPTFNQLDMAKDWCGMSRVVNIVYEVQSWVVFGFWLAIDTDDHRSAARRVGRCSVYWKRSR